MVGMRVTPETPTVHIVGAGGPVGPLLQGGAELSAGQVLWRPLTSADIDIADEA